MKTEKIKEKCADDFLRLNRYYKQLLKDLNKELKEAKEE